MDSERPLPPPKRCARIIPARTSGIDDFILHMHRLGAPTVLLQLVYYVSIAWPATTEDLVDSLEVFAGAKQYTEASGT
jgi:hypothetical protein